MSVKTVKIPLTRVFYQHPIVSLLNAAPYDPSGRERYIVGTSPQSGDPFHGHNNEIALYNAVNESWEFEAPIYPTVVFLETVKELHYYDGTGWRALTNV